MKWSLQNKEKSVVTDLLYIIYSTLRSKHLNQAPNEKAAGQVF